MCDVDVLWLNWSFFLPEKHYIIISQKKRLSAAPINRRNVQVSWSQSIARSPIDSRDDEAEKFPIPSANVTKIVDFSLRLSRILLYRLLFIHKNRHTLTHRLFTSFFHDVKVRWSELVSAWCWFEIWCVVCCVFFGFFGISVPLHIVVRINSIEILFSFLSRGFFFSFSRKEEKSRFLIIKIVFFTVTDRPMWSELRHSKTRSVEFRPIRPWVGSMDVFIMWQLWSASAHCSHCKNTFSSRRLL